MFENKIRLAKPWIPEEVLKKLKIIFKSGWISGGSQSKKFAIKVAEVEGYKYGVATNSCTSALQIAVELSSLDKKMLRIPNITFPSSANAIIATGLTPLITNPPFDLGVDLFGLKGKNRNWAVGDCACSFGSTRFKEKPLIACYSFHARKVITTGEGGVLCTDNEEIAEAAVELVGQGSHSGFEYSMRMSDINAVIGLAQLDLLDEILERRHKIVEWYNAYLPLEIDIYGQNNRKTNKKFNYQTMVILLPINIDLFHVHSKLNADGIECNLGTYRLDEMPYYRKYVDIKVEFEKFNYLALPLYHEINEETVKTICKKLKKHIARAHELYA